jgi:hypothetical protein
MLDKGKVADSGKQSSLLQHTLVSSIIACKYWTKVEVDDSVKHSSLLQYTLVSSIHAYKYWTRVKVAYSGKHSSLLQCTLVSSIHAYKYWTRVEVAYSGKHSSLLRYDNNKNSKKFNSTGPLSRIEATGFEHLTPTRVIDSSKTVLPLLAKSFFTTVILCLIYHSGLYIS